eukprot:COSAG02_NODE_431_length_22447_cov_7.487202_11_plen_63_part_00
MVVHRIRVLIIMLDGHRHDILGRPLLQVFGVHLSKSRIVVGLSSLAFSAISKRIVGLDRNGE